MDEDGNLWCYGCLKFLSPEQFGKNADSRDGRKSKCKDCSREVRVQTLSNPEACLRESVRRARDRDEDCTLDLDWAIRQFAHQDGKCFYTDIPMTTGAGSGRVWTSVSIDRVDSSLSYTPDNCVLCCTAFNIMKGDLSLETVATLAKSFLDKMARKKGV